MREKGRGGACFTEGGDDLGEGGNHYVKGEDHDEGDHYVKGEDHDGNEEDGNEKKSTHNTKEDSHHMKENGNRMADLQRQLRENPYSAIVTSPF